ncbi:WD40 repeat domain-containing protein [Streptomyces tricolor]|uniref:WD40 repeat domain-containing protein n=1 Tax=Streptomyces tricolor TaxID=68277 RepID=UPI0038030EBC
MTFSRDGRYLAAGGLRGRVTIWDGNLRQRLGVLAGADTGGRRGYRESVTSLAFSLDSRLLAVGGDYGTIQMRDTASSRAVGSALPTPGDLVLALAFGTDGNTLRVAGTHVFPREHELNWTHLVKQACARGRGGLSAASWETYLADVPYRRTC